MQSAGERHSAHHRLTTLEQGDLFRMHGRLPKNQAAKVGRIGDVYRYDTRSEKARRFWAADPKGTMSYSTEG